MIKTIGDRYEVTGTVVFGCGCGDTVPQVKTFLRKAKVEVPYISVPSNSKVRRYIKQERLKDAIPALSNGKYGILFNPKTRQFIDLLRAPKTEQVFNNIRIVVNGQG